MGILAVCSKTSRAHAEKLLNHRFKVQGSGLGSRVAGATISSLVVVRGDQGLQSGDSEFWIGPAQYKHGRSAIYRLVWGYVEVYTDIYIYLYIYLHLYL